MKEGHPSGGMCCCFVALWVASVTIGAMCFD